MSTPNPVGNTDTSTNVSPVVGSGLTGTPSGSSFLSDFTTGLTNTLGGTSLGSALGTITPYAAVAGIGEAQAAAGQKQDAAAAATQEALAQPAIQESTNLLGQYTTGTLNPTDAAVVNTGIAQGQDTIASANGLSAIAQTAFANYNNGTLTAGDQAALDQQVAAAKQQVAQQLSSAGITDSTIIAAQNNQIDQQALVTKQNMLNSYFTTGNQAYDSWLTATNEGKAQITAAQTYASTSLTGYLNASMAEAGIGMTEMNTAIQTQMQTDQEYAAQVSTLMGTLASAYAKQMAGNASKTGSTSGLKLPSSGTGGGGGGGGGGSGTGAPPGGDVSGGVDPSTGVPYDIENPGTGSAPPTAANPFSPDPNDPFAVSTPDANWNSVTDSDNSGDIGDDLGDIFGG
jgi:hypothetical protein